MKRAASYLLIAAVLFSFYAFMRWVA